MGSDRPILNTRGIILNETDIKFEPVITKSKPNAFPSALRAKHTNVQTLTEADIKGEALMQHSCTECGNESMFYHEKQLRSADEGTTIFYRCPVCDHRYAHRVKLRSQTKGL